MKIVVAMLDRKAGFDAVQVVQNEEIAKRSFSYAINNGGIPSYMPGDFDLYKVGEFDEKTGELLPVQPIQLLMSGMEVFSK